MNQDNQFSRLWSKKKFHNFDKLPKYEYELGAACGLWSMDLGLDKTVSKYANNNFLFPW